MYNNDFTIAICLFANALALIFLFITYRKFIRAKQFLHNSKSTIGTVISVHEYKDYSPMSGKSMHGKSKIEMDDRVVHHTTKMYKPTVTYVVNGNKYILKTNYSTSKLKQVGGQIEVLYNIASPQHGKLRMFIYFWTQFFGIFSIIFLTFGLGSLLLVMTM